MTPELRASIKRRAEEKYPFVDKNAKMTFDVRQEVDRVTTWQRRAFISAQEEVYEKIEEIRKAVEQRISEMEQALKQLPKDQHERVKGNLSSCDKILSIIDKHLK